MPTLPISACYAYNTLDINDNRRCTETSFTVRARPTVSGTRIFEGDPEWQLWNYVVYCNWDFIALTGYPLAPAYVPAIDFAQVTLFEQHLLSPTLSHQLTASYTGWNGLCTYSGADLGIPNGVIISPGNKTFRLNYFDTGTNTRIARLQERTKGETVGTVAYLSGELTGCLISGVVDLINGTTIVDYNTSCLTLALYNKIKDCDIKVEAYSILSRPTTEAELITSTAEAIYCKITGSDAYYYHVSAQAISGIFAPFHVALTATVLSSVGLTADTGNIFDETSASQASFYLMPLTMGVVESEYNYASAYILPGYQTYDPETDLIYDYTSKTMPLLSSSDGLNFFGYDISGAKVVLSADTVGLSVLMLANNTVSTLPVTAYYPHILSGFLLTSLNVPSTYNVTLNLDNGATHQPYSYTFVCDPILSQELNINVFSREIDGNNVTETLTLVRDVTTIGGNIIRDVPIATPVAWTSGGTGIIGASANYIYDSVADPTYQQAIGFPYTGAIIPNVYGYGQLGPQQNYNWNMFVADTLTSIKAFYDGDVIKVTYDDLLVDSLSATISGQYINPPVLLTEHVYTPYVDPGGLNIQILSITNQPLVRTVIARVLDNNLNLLHPTINIAWVTNRSNITAYNLDGTQIPFGTFVEDQTVVLEAQPALFEYPNIGTNEVFNLTVSAQYTFVTPYYVLPYTDSETILLDTFPGTSRFNADFTVNNVHASAVSFLVMPFTNPFPLTISDATFVRDQSAGISVFVLSGTFGTITTATNSTTVNLTTPGIYSVDLHYMSAIGAGWLSAHSADISMNVSLVSAIPTATFMAYPSTVFNSVSGRIVIDSSNLTAYVFGVSSYDITNQENFILCATNVSDLSSFGGLKYNWYVSGEKLSFEGPTAVYQAIGILTGSEIKLRLTTNDIPINAPDFYYITGTQVAAPWVTATSAQDMSNRFFQHIRAYDFDTRHVMITSCTLSAIISPSGIDTIFANVSISDVPSSSPTFDNNVYTLIYRIINPLWNIPASYAYILPETNHTDIVYEIAYKIGNSYAFYIPNQVEGQESRYEVYALIRSSIGLTGQPTQSYEVSSEPAYVYITGAPITQFVLDSYIALTGAPIHVINNTLPMNVFDHFNFVTYTGSISTISSTPFNSFDILYSADGTFYPHTTTYYLDSAIGIDLTGTAVRILNTYENYDPDIKHILGVTQLELPYSYDEIKLGPNDWCIEDNIDEGFRKLTTNLTYLQNMLLFYNLPPTKYVGWFGTYQYNSLHTHTGWKIKDMTTKYIDPSAGITGVFANLIDVAKNGNYFYTIDSNILKIIKDNNIIATTDKTYYNVPFTDLRRVLVDTAGRIFVLNGLSVTCFDDYFNNNEFVVYNSWGKYGSTNSKFGWYKPNSIVFDEEYVWVVSTGNKALKKYSKSGEWVENINCTHLDIGDDITNGGMIDIAFDLNGYIHILTKDSIIKITRAGVVLNTISLSEYLPYGSPHRIIAMSQNKGFLYVSFDHIIVKIKEDGLFAGTIGEELGNTNNFNGLYQDEKFNLYVTNNINFLVYIDIIQITDLTNDTVDPYYWDLTETAVKSNEYVQDWVYTKAFSRMWDNIELMRRSILGKPVFGYSGGIATVSIVNPDLNTYIDSIPLTKDSVIYGINEFTAVDVFNRNVKILVTNQEKILKLLQNE